MSERSFLPEAKRLGDEFSKQFETLKKILDDASVSEENKKKAFGEMQKIAIAAVGVGQYHIVKEIVHYIPADASEVLTSSEGKVTTIQQYKKDLIRYILGYYGAGKFGNSVFDFTLEMEEEIRKNTSEERAIRKAYAKKAEEYRNSDRFNFFYVFLVQEIHQDDLLRSQLIEGPEWATLFSVLFVSSHEVGVDERVSNDIFSLFDLLPSHKKIQALKMDTAYDAALTVAGVENEKGSSEKTVPLSGKIDIRRAFDLLEKVSIKNNDGAEQSREVADAYYAIITAYSFELLDHGIPYVEIARIAESIEYCISKQSGRRILQGHVEAIREEASLRAAKKAA